MSEGADERTARLAAIEELAELIVDGYELQQAHQHAKWLRDTAEVLEAEGLGDTYNEREAADCIEHLAAEVGALRQALQSIDEIVNLPANAVVDRVGRIAAIVRAAAGSERNETHDG